MSEAGDYVPADHWKGHDFKSARRDYDDVRKRSYDDAVANDVDITDLVPEILETDAEAPLVIVSDETGSMGEWPAVIFSKLPYLEHEVQEYLGDGMEISFAAVGDIYTPGERYGVQIRPFAKKDDLKNQLKKLIIEGKGGGQTKESYDAVGLYYARHCKMPGAIRKPIFIFIGDEGAHKQINKEDAQKWTRTDIGQKKILTVEEIFQELQEKFSVYMILKPYNLVGGDDDPTNKAIREEWVRLLGADHICPLPSADRVVDVIFGILAKETGRISYFEKELKDRQGKDKDGDKKIDVVLKSLRTIHNIPKDSLNKIAGPKGAKSKSITPGKSKSKKTGGKSISLLD